MEGQPAKRGANPNAGPGKPQEHQKQGGGGGPPQITSFFKKVVAQPPASTIIPSVKETNSPSQMQDVAPQNIPPSAAEQQPPTEHQQLTVASAKLNNIIDPQVEELKCKEKPEELSPLKNQPRPSSSSQESPSKRNLRPRKVENYQAMLDDEVTRKTILYEEQEKKRLAVPPPEEEEQLLQQEIERASDDGEEEEGDDRLTPLKRGRKQLASATKRGGGRRIIDEDEDQELAGYDAVEEEESAAIQEEEDDDEESYAVRGSKRKAKSVRKNAAASGQRGKQNQGAKRGGKASASAPRTARSRGRGGNKKDDFALDGGEGDEDLDDPNFEEEAAVDDDHFDDAVADDSGEDEDDDGAGAAVIRKGKGGAAATANTDETVFIDNLPNDEFEIRRMLKEVKKHIKLLEKMFFEEEDSEKEDELKQISNVAKHEEALAAFKEHAHLKQFWCIPLSVNVTSFDFDLLGKSQMKSGGRLFDVITIDPPWQLSSANPTRGVAIAYDTLNDKEILNIPFDKIQTDGFLFIWVINAKYLFALDIMEQFGYKLVDEIAWVKQTVNGKIAKGHGYYLQHAKETCLVGVKGNVEGKARLNIESDVIFSQRRGQSQKPEEIYEIAESLVPNGYYLEIFGRRNNLHNGWVTIGNEL